MKRYEGQDTTPRREPVKEATLETILKELLNVSTQLDTLNSKIDALVADQATLVTSINVLGTEYGVISTDIKNMLIEIQNEKGVDLSGPIAKLDAADAAVKSATTAVNSITAKAQADDKSVNPSGPSNFGEVPA